MKYFNENNEYKEPTLIKFDTPKVIKLVDLRDFLKQYEPFPCSDVFVYERFEYGDFDNWVDGIIQSITIDPTFTKYYNKQEGIFEPGDYKFCLQNTFWNYSKDKPFWTKAPSLGYFEPLASKYKSINDIEISIEGVFVISWSDKSKIEGKING